MNLVELSKKESEIVNGGIDMLKVSVAGGAGCIAGITSNIGDRIYNGVLGKNVTPIPFSQSCLNGAIYGTTLALATPRIELFAKRVFQPHNA